MRALHFQGYNHRLVMRQNEPSEIFYSVANNNLFVTDIKYKYITFDSYY